MKIGSRVFPLDKGTYVMGILNITPDSFSDGGRHNRLDEAVSHALRMIEEGADIIDVGGESTRPNYTMISEDEELSRVIPVIEAIRRVTDIPVSIDTYKSRVADAACQAGADLINDIWGLRYDPDMVRVAVKNRVPVCLMHNRKTVDYKDFYKDFINDMKECIRIALDAGISKDDIILDPGIGFGKTYEMNLYLLSHLKKLHELGFPVLLGASRKSVIGLTLNEPVENRLEGTLATTVVAVMNGVQFIRVHDVKENIRAIRMTEAIRYQSPNE
ncbi:MAG TPA: dihydropteroate synthase [Clostridiales bacterium]|nr:dihydropteroate synthase [Clostridiales bacterium]